MTKRNWFKPLYVAFITMCLAVIFLGTIVIPAKSQTVYAASGDYTFSLSKYTLVYDINADRTMHVSEDLDINFTGRLSTGFIRDIPVNAGDRVKNIKVYNSDGSTADYSVYMEDTSFISVDIGDTSHKSGIYNFKIEYDYEITKPTDKNTIYLNAIGYGWECTIQEAHVTLNLPQGYASAKYYVGNTTTESSAYTYNSSTNTITADVSNLPTYTGVTFALQFNDGVLSTRFDYSMFIVLIIGLVLLAVLACVKFLAFNSSKLAPVVNFTAPDEMDPLVMGKLIDNNVNPEDITSMIYYWANKGYLKINLENKNDPTLIKVFASLPDDAPSHQKRMYTDLFRRGDVVKTSQLTNSFYKTVDAVRKDVNASHKGLYSSKSISISILFALLGALLISVTPILLTLINISSKMFVYHCLVMIVPALIAYGMTESFMFYSLKYSRKRLILSFVGVGLLCAVFTAIYAFVMPTALMETSTTITACIFGFLTAALSVTLIQRTPEYTEKLNHILGFRNFILYTEKERLEALLEENPQFYYHILPYAQVLGVTDKWEKQFKSITVAPPNWMVSHAGTYFEFSAMNHMFRRMNMTMVSTMTSRPSSSGGSGGVGGIGGHGGGGHGGGGGRGR